MKRVYTATALTALVMLIIAGILVNVRRKPLNSEKLHVGFIYENDESTPYTYNFTLAERALAAKYADSVEIFAFRNVLESETSEPLRELLAKGCKIIFTNGFSAQFREMAQNHPDVQFCQVSCVDVTDAIYPPNYHTFNGEAYQYQYVSGVTAGMKLRSLIDANDITADQALIGFVGNYPNPDVISGFTAFFLGVRTVAPEARMRVRYTYAWSSYTREKAVAKALIDEGCTVIAQQSHTFGPAAACEEGAQSQIVFHVGNHQSMLDVAPTTSLISGRVNWTPYILGAVEAVLRERTIETTVNAARHGNDMSAGFSRDWVEMLELNMHIAAPGTQEKIDRTVEALRKGQISVFQGEYIGIDPNDPEDTMDISHGYSENTVSSYPSFHYILQDYILQEN